MKSAPQSPLAVERACWQGEAVARRGGRTRAQAEDACELVEVELGAAARRRRHGDRARCQDAGDPSRARRQPLLPAQARRRQGRRRLRRRPTSSSRTPSSSAATPASPSSRARSWPTTTAASSKLTVHHAHAGAAHDAGRVRPAPRHARAQRARASRKDVGGSFGIKVHVYRRRDGDGGAVDAAEPAGQVRRRPAGELRHRHPRPRPPRQGRIGVDSDGTHHRLRHRRPDRHRPLLGLSAHQRASRATRWSTWSAGPTTCPNYRAPGARRVHEQERRPASTAPSAIRSRWR